METGIRDLDEQSINHLQHLVINGALRDAVTAFGHARTMKNGIIKSKNFENLKMLTVIRGEFLNE